MRRLRRPGRAVRGGAALRLAAAGRARRARRRSWRARASRSPPSRPTCVEILEPILASTPECAALFAPGGRLLGEGDPFRQPELGDALERLGGEGAAPFYARRRSPTAVLEWLTGRGAMLTARGPRRLRVIAARAGAGALPRPRGADQPAAVGGRDPLAYALCAAGARRAARPTPAQLVAAMDGGPGRAHARVPRRACREEGFVERFLRVAHGLDHAHLGPRRRRAARARSRAPTARARAIVVPGTGIHLNNMLGEQDLNPLGFHRHPARTAAAQHDGARRWCCATARPSWCWAAAGSNRIRSAILQTIVGVVDRGMRRRRGGARAAPALRGGGRLRRAGHRRRRAGATGRAVARFRDAATCSSAACRRCAAIRPAARSAAPATRAAAALSRWSDHSPPRRGAGRAGARRLRGAAPPDLFVVDRTGTVPGARLDLRVSDEGR